MVKVEVTHYRIINPSEVYNVFHKTFENQEQAQKYIDAVTKRDNVRAKIVE